MSNWDGPVADPGEKTIYLDSAATSRPFPEAVAAAAKAMETGYGNPSSRHGLGLAAAREIEEARSVVAGAIGASPREVVFTGGGSEANNLALKGAAWSYSRAGRQVVVSAVEHPSVVETARWLEEALGLEVAFVPVDAHGLVEVSRVLGAVTDETLLVSVMHVNNEVGAIQPVAEVGRGLRARRASSGKRKGLPLFHVDAVQSLGRIPIDVGLLGADLLSASGHKVHGPKGVGALYVRAGVRVTPLIHGGGHESGRRSGTENVPGIAGFGAALARRMEAGPARTARSLRAMRARLVDIVREGWPSVVVNGPGDPDLAAPHIVSLSFPGIPAEVMQNHLQRSGVYVSTGSACSSHHQKRGSHVLAAMGLASPVAESAVRLSLSVLNTPEEIEEAGRAVVAAAGELAPA